MPKLLIKEDKTLMLKTKKKTEVDALAIRGKEYTYLVIKNNIQNDTIKEEVSKLESEIFTHNIYKGL